MNKSMDNTILIWKYLLPSLLENEELKSYIGDRLFPLLANPETQYPFVIYRRDSISVEYTKKPMINWDNRVTISLGVYSEDYTTGIEILNIIRNIFEGKCLHCEEINIDEIKITEVGEIKGDDCYIQTITFSFLAE